MQEQHESRRPDRPCVLIVEDEAFIRMDAAAMLDEAGFQTIEAANAMDAIAALESGIQVDLIFTDLNMPGMSGLDLSAAVHARWPTVAILMTSGRMDIPLKIIPDHGLFVKKPYEPAALVRMIRESLDKARSP